MQEKRSWAQQWLAVEKKHYFNGAFQQTKHEGNFQVVNPATKETLCSVPLADSQTVDSAVAAAGEAQKAWAKTPRRERQQALKAIGEIIRKHHDELATLETLANGKLFKESYRDDVPEAADVFDYYAGWIDKIYSDVAPTDDGFFNYTLREPVGVCGLIVPWNFPLLMACWKLAPALAFGNTVILKPSEYTPLSVIRLAELIHEHAVLPKGVFNLLLGDGKTGAALCSHPHVHKITFTGSTDVGRKVVSGSAASNLKSVSLELGGKSPNILFADTLDPETAIKRQYSAIFSHKGEKCSEPTLFIVHQSLYQQALDQLKALCDKARLGDPFDGKTHQGAQANESQYKKILQYIAWGKEDGARLIAGGEADVTGSNGNGYFIRPTVFADVKPDMRIASDEIFGPVLSVFSFSSDDEAVAIANSTKYGLAAGLYTQNISRAHRVAEELEAGMIFINQYGMYDFASPFGGYKQSGWGKELGKHSLDTYTKTKSVWIKL